MRWKPAGVALSVLAAGIFCIALLRPWNAVQNAQAADRIAREYASGAGRLVERYCHECHSGDAAEAEIDLASFKNVADARARVGTWLKVREMLDSGQMPPPDADQPTAAERTSLRQWVRDFLAEEAKANAGDPGPVVLRRLSNAEYTYTIRDLTGMDVLDPAQAFPVDGGAGEGFTNTGSGQGMSPALAQKYVDAAKQAAEHVVLLPDGVRFSRWTSRRDRTDELLARIQAYYRRYTADEGGTAVDLQGVRFETNQGGRLPLERYFAATIEERDALRRSATTIEAVARERGLSARYLAALWDLLADEPGRPSLLLDAVRRRWLKAGERDIEALCDAIAETQKALWKFNSVGHIGRQGGPKAWMEPELPVPPGGMLRLKLLDDPVAFDPRDEAVERACDEFRELFPAALCYARIVPVDEVVTLTLFHREDDHLGRLMLGRAEAAELDRLWDELHYVSEEPLQLVAAFEQISEFATQDRPDLVKSFAPMRAGILERAEAYRQRRAETEPIHVQAVLNLAERAWRRPLAGQEQASLHGLYRQMRERELSHEHALRLLLARVLSSPMFLYKIEHAPPGHTPAPVSDGELATRLSYFLWSSLPDEPLRAAADGRRLSEGPELLSQTRRMLRDPRARRLAVEFFCQWFNIRNFGAEAEKNERLYPEFAALREAMHEESVRFFEDVIRENRSVLELLDADHAFVNESLARHYGISGVAGPDWRRIDGVRAMGRGGVLGMAAVLASQSGASRTSPILRGNWVYETLLGERLPRPPADVPQLPDEVPGGLTERQLIEQHSSVAACAKCHARIDPYGFALEQYDAIGRRRAQQVDARATLVDGTRVDGIDGLRRHLVVERHEAFIRQFCRKLLGYALGRAVQLSDEPLLDEMQARLEAGEYRFHVAVEAIVTSRQFRTIRGRDQVEDE